MAQLEQGKELLQNSCSELQRIHTEEQERHKNELELTVNHYNNLMTQLKQEQEMLQNSCNEMQQSIVELQQSTMEMQQVIVEKDELIHTYADSTSWKMTEPFRKFMRMFKNK